MCEKCVERAEKDLVLIGDLKRVLEVNEGGLKEYLAKEIEKWEVKANIARELMNPRTSNKSEAVKRYLEEYPEIMAEMLMDNLFGSEDEE